MLLFIFFAGRQLVHANSTMRKITGIEEAVWVFKTGIDRAKYHDVQDLGIILKEYSTIKIRKHNISNGYQPNLRIRLLTNVYSKERLITFTNDWKTIQVNYDSVPFIETPFGSSAEIEYFTEGDVTKLPIYHEHSDEQSFFQDWDQTHAPFGLIKGTNFQLLVPGEEKDLLRKLKDFSNLDEYITYQSSIISTFDDIVGLSPIAEGVHRTPKQRFFLKVTREIDNYANYFSQYIATSDKASNMWMTKWNWEVLDQIGHGYETSYKSQEMNLSDVSHKLLAIFLISKNGGNINNSWLFRDNKTKVENSLYDKLDNKKTRFNDLDNRDRLNLLAALTQSLCGYQIWTNFNKMYRESLNKGNSNVKLMSLADSLNIYRSRYEKKDFTPVFAKWGILLRETRQQYINRGNSYPAVASLTDIVPRDKLEKAVTLLSDHLMIDTIFSLVTNYDIEPLNLSGGSLDILLNIEYFKILRGKTLLIKSGDKIIKEMQVDCPYLTIPEMKNGVYTLQFLQTKDVLVLDNYYVYVRDKHNKATVNIRHWIGSNIFDETFYFKGLGDHLFAILQTDFENRKMSFKIIDSRPHIYFKKIYAILEVLDEKENSIYRKEIQGESEEVRDFDIPLEEGYKIKFYHLEAGDRLVCISTHDLINQKANNNTIIVKNGYLVNRNGNPHVNTRISKILKSIASLKADQELSKIMESPEKNRIIVAISSLPQEKRDQLFAEYQDFLFVAPESNLSKFSITDWFREPILNLITHNSSVFKINYSLELPLKT